MERTILAFHEDDLGDWVAELSCLHNQHVRHRPPLFERTWVLTEVGRESHVGAAIDCPLCDRAELPNDLVLTNTAGPFHQAGIPAALLRAHVVPGGSWGVLRVLHGSVTFSMATNPPIERRMARGEQQAIPPGIAHHLVLEGAVTLAIDFLSRA